MAMLIAGIFSALFTLLKLTGVIAWSWWLVFSPMLFCFVLGLLFIVGAIVFSWKYLA